jgi:hypothetical protein
MLAPGALLVVFVGLVGSHTILIIVVAITIMMITLVIVIVVVAIRKLVVS